MPRSLKGLQQYVSTKRRKAFTLIELIIAVVIISILVGIVMATMGSSTDKAEATKVVSDLRNIKSRALIFYIDNERWPTSMDDSKLVIPKGCAINNRYLYENPYDVKFLYQVNLTAQSGDSVKSHITVMATRHPAVPDKDMKGVCKYLAKMALKVGLTTDGMPLKDDLSNLYKGELNIPFGIPVQVRE